MTKQYTKDYHFINQTHDVNICLLLTLLRCLYVLKTWRVLTHKLKYIYLLKTQQFDLIYLTN